MFHLIESRWLSAIVVLIVAVIALYSFGGEFTVKLLVALIFPVACIWYSEELGRLVGFSGGLQTPRVTESTPGVMVAIGGWLLLVCVVTVAFFVKFLSG